MCWAGRHGLDVLGGRGLRWAGYLRGALTERDGGQMDDGWTRRSGEEVR